MPWNAPAAPVSGTTITVAWAIANIIDPINWLRLMAGNADPPNADYVLVSTGPGGVTWQKVPAAALAAGVAVANLGYTPINPAGGTMIGQFMVNRTQGFTNTAFATAPLVVQSPDAAINPSETAGIGFHRLNGSGVYLGHVGSAAADILRLFPNTGPSGTVWSSLNQGAGSGLDADLLDGQSSAFYATAASVTAEATARAAADTAEATARAAADAAINQVPSGAIVAFETLAELTAAGAGWARYTAANGRLLVGAGTTFSQTFAQATDYGANWTPFTGVSGFTGTAADAVNVTPSGATSVSAASHQNALSIAAQTWLPVARGVIWGRKI